MEYLCAEVLELAGNTTRDCGKTRLIPKHLNLAVYGDPELAGVNARLQVFEAPVLGRARTFTPLAPSAVKPPTEPRATVHVVDVQAAGIDEDFDADDDDTTEEEWSRKRVDKLLAHFPSLRARARNGDLLENSAEAGYRSSGWSHIHIDGETIRVISLDKQWDHYGCANTAYFPVLTVFPCDYWDNMVGLEHLGGTTVSETGRFRGYWHSDDCPVFFDTPHLFTEQGELAEHLTEGDWRLVQDTAQDGSMWALLYHIPHVTELRHGLRPQQPFRFPVLRMDDAVREIICPHVTPGFAAIMEDTPSIDRAAQERLGAAAVLVKSAK